MRTSMREKADIAEREALDAKRSGNQQAEKREEKGKRQGGGRREGDPTQPRREKNRRDRKREEGNCKRKRAGKLSKDAIEGLDENGRKRKQVQEEFHEKLAE